VSTGIIIIIIIIKYIYIAQICKKWHLCAEVHSCMSDRKALGVEVLLLVMHIT